MSDKHEGDDLDAMLQQLEEEAGAEGGGDVSDEEMAELEKALADAPSPSEEAAAAKKKSGNKPTLAEELEADELEGLDLDDVPEGESPEDAELPDDLELGGDSQPEGEGAAAQDKTPTGAEAAPKQKPQSDSRQAGDATTKTADKSDSTAEVGDGKPDNPPATQENGGTAGGQQAAGAEQTQSSTDDGAGQASGVGKWAGRVALVTLKWTLYAAPSLILLWTVGAFLGRWVTAGWLIGAVSVLVALGVPMLAYDMSGRPGRKRWWFAGSGVLLTALLVAPMPQTAGDALAEHGYWPGQVVDEIGMGDNNVVQRASWGLGREIGGLLGASVSADASYTALGVAPGAETSGGDDGGQTGGEASRAADESQETAENVADQSNDESGSSSGGSVGKTNE